MWSHLWRGQGTQERRAFQDDVRHHVDRRIVWLIATTILCLMASRAVVGKRSTVALLREIHRRSSTTVQPHESLPMPPGHHDCG